MPVAYRTHFDGDTGPNGEVYPPFIGLHFLCAACRSGHVVAIEGTKMPNGTSWKWNGDLEKPTLEPSVKYPGPPVCHFRLINGVQHFSDDTEFAAFRDKAVPLEQIEP